MSRIRLPVLMGAVICLAVASVSFADDSNTVAASAAETSMPAMDSERLDHLLSSETDLPLPWPTISDEHYLRRITLDLAGRQPTREELASFLADRAGDKRHAAIERLLASEEFGVNWANYWSDTIAYRVPQPELTFLSYTTLEGWLARKLNQNSPWDEVVRELLTATGKVKENPAATFVGFHEGNATRLASETSRIFLGLNLQCAQCHDHPFESWKQEEYHRLAAFFARTAAKLPWNDSDAIVVSDRGKGEHRLPADAGKKGAVMTPAFLDGDEFQLEADDLSRRQFLAEMVTARDNPWFAKAYVNRIWARLMGEGFCEPVDNIGETQTVTLPKTHAALSAHFAASKFNVKDLFRLIMASTAYQRPIALADATADPQSSFATMRPRKLRGDEVFDSLVTAVGLPNVTPEPMKASGDVRFPPPPKSTRDLVTDAFGFDPSLAARDVPRTMPQVMLLMNNSQIQSQIDARLDSGTWLAKLLASEKDNATVLTALFEAALGRRPTAAEAAIGKQHVQAVGDRDRAFEDLLWGLLNSAEFTTRR